MTTMRDFMKARKAAQTTRNAPAPKAETPPAPARPTPKPAGPEAPPQSLVTYFCGHVEPAHNLHGRPCPRCLREARRARPKAGGAEVQGPPARRGHLPRQLRRRPGALGGHPDGRRGRLRGRGRGLLALLSHLDDLYRAAGQALPAEGA